MRDNADSSLSIRTFSQTKSSNASRSSTEKVCRWQPNCRNVQTRLQVFFIMCFDHKAPYENKNKII